MSNMENLGTRIVTEVHGSRYSIHPDSTKMYHDLKHNYWLDGMKKDILDYVAKSPNCQQVKAEHLKPGCPTQIIEVPTWKWDAINHGWSSEE